MAEVSAVAALAPNVSVTRLASGLRGPRGLVVVESGDVLVVELPRQGRKTVYGALGDWLVVLCALGLGALAIRQHGLSLAAWARLSPLAESVRS